MNYNIETIDNFEKQAKQLLRKYPSLKNELEELEKSLSENPFQGDRLVGNCYKIRIPIKSKQSGKSGGARIITNIVVVRKKVFLLSIYDKSERASISNKEIKELIKRITF